MFLYPSSALDNEPSDTWVLPSKRDEESFTERFPAPLDAFTNSF